MEVKSFLIEDRDLHILHILSTNIMAADCLVTQGARASAAMPSTYIFLNILPLAPYEL